MHRLTLSDVISAHERIKAHIRPTPVFNSEPLNTALGGHQIFFKAENLQHGGAFKARGALSALTHLKLKGDDRPVVTYSSGNHATAVSFAGAKLNIPVRVHMPVYVSAVKKALTESFGATVITHKNRQAAEQACAAEAASGEAALIPPFDHDDVIAGQGTTALELLDEIAELDAIITPVGGGGLLSGTVISTRAKSPDTTILGAEPLLGNDAARTVQKAWAKESAQGLSAMDDPNKLKDCIVKLPETPKTLADGAATHAVTPRTLQYLRQIDAPIFEITEREMCYWTQWLTHTLKLHIEPTSAMGMAGIARWLQEQPTPKRVAVILSGGNIDPAKVLSIWSHNHLLEPVTLSGPN